MLVPILIMIVACLSLAFGVIDYKAHSVNDARRRLKQDLQRNRQELRQPAVIARERLKDIKGKDIREHKKRLVTIIERLKKVKKHNKTKLLLKEYLIMFIDIKTTDFKETIKYIKLKENDLNGYQL